MEIPTSLFEKLLFNTVRIEATLKDGSQISGTGFFFWLYNWRTTLLLFSNKQTCHWKYRSSKFSF